MVDEIESAISESISDLPGSDADASLDATPDTATPDTPEPTAETPETPDAPAPVKVLSRSQQRIQQLANERKADQERHAAEIKARDEERERYKWAIEDEHAKLKYDAMGVAENEPERFARIIAGLPEYQQFIALKQAQEAAAAAGAAPDAGRLAEPTFPEPDAQYADGSPAHTPEAIAKYVRDVASYVNQQAEAKYEKRFNDLESRVQPIVQERVDKELYDKSLTSTQSAFSKVEKVYGPLATEMKPQMHAWLKKEWAANRSPTLHDAVEAVLVPAILKERDDARADKLKASDGARARVVSDMNTRAAAAERSAPLEAGTPLDEPDDDITAAIKSSIKSHPDRR